MKSNSFVRGRLVALSAAFAVCTTDFSRAEGTIWLAQATSAPAPDTATPMRNAQPTDATDSVRESNNPAPQDASPKEPESSTAFEPPNDSDVQEGLILPEGEEQSPMEASDELQELTGGSAGAPAAMDTEAAPDAGEPTPALPGVLAQPAQSDAVKEGGTTDSPTQDVQRPAASTPAIAPRESAGAATTPAARRPPIDTAPLMARGQTFLQQRDIASARLFFQRAVDHGDVAAMTALGQTFDPLELRRLGVLGIKGDPKRAMELYRAAAAAGDATAEQSMTRLSDWIERTR